MTPFRLQTLLIIAFTQYVMRYAALMPLARAQGVELQLSDFAFFCLVISTIFIAAAGLINERKKIATHIILSGIGILPGVYAITEAGAPNLILTFAATAILLLLYLFVYKHHFLVGNIIVALFFAIVPLMVLLDILPIYFVYGKMNVNLNFAMYWFAGVSLFIFLSVLSCEIIKDTEDFENDNVTCDTRSFPFIMSAMYAKWTIIGINTANIAIICLIYCLFLRNIAGLFSFFYLLLILIIPILLINWKVHNAIIGNDYRLTGNLMKLVMLAGVAYSGILWWYF